MKSPITILHGYRLDGSGSCIYCRNVARNLSEMGLDVILVCQELRPERYDFISEAYVFSADGKPEQVLKRPPQSKGRVISFRPYLTKGLLPVYVDVKFPQSKKVKPFYRLTDDEINDYVDNHVVALKKIGQQFPLNVIYANHIVMMPYIAYLASKEMKQLLYFLIPHGSEIEYLIKKDKRFLSIAEESLAHAAGIISGSEEMTHRIAALFKNSKRFLSKVHQIPIGVDVEYFSSSQKSSVMERVENLRKEVRLQIQTSTTSVDSADPRFLNILEQIDFAHSKTIVNFGRLIPEKGVQDLIVIAPVLCKEISSLRIIIAGNGPYKEFFQKLVELLQAGDERQFHKEIERVDRETSSTAGSLFRFVREFLRSESGSGYFSFSSSFEWSKNVVFVGYLKHPALRYLLSLSDLAVFPSIVKEAYPLALLEAMAAGAFPVVSDFGGLHDGLKVLGELFSGEMTKLMRVTMDEAQRIKEMRDHILQGLNKYSPQERAKMVQHIQANCSWKRICGLLLKVFEGGVNRHQASHSFSNRLFNASTRPITEEGERP